MGTAQTHTRFVNTCTRFALAAMIAGGLGACSWNEQRSETVGSVVGGVVGGILGSKIGDGAGKSAATVVGATLGVMAGQDIAKGLTDIDKHYMDRTTADTLEYGEPGEHVTWSNPDTGASGSVTAGEPYANDGGENCRTFETTVNADGESRTGEGTACRQADGTWTVVEEPA